MNVMFSSAGRRCLLIQFMKKALNGTGKVIAGDCSPHAPAMYEADEAVILPQINDPTYVDKLIESCKKHDVKVLISLIDPELSILSLNKEKFKQNGIQCIVSDYTAVETCFDKYEFYKFLKQHGYSTIPTYRTTAEADKALENKEVHYPLMIKPCKGSASIGLKKIEKREDLPTIVESDNMIIQQFIDGQEFGVDVYRDMISRKVISVFPKKKIVMRAGETDKAISTREQDAIKLSEKLVTDLNLIGPIDIDCFQTAQGWIASEINPRFGGGHPLAHACGLDYMTMILNNVNGKENTPNPPYKNNINMFKYEVICVKEETELIPMKQTIPLSAPFIEEDDIQAVTNVMRTPTLSIGPKVQEFEQKVAQFAGTKYAVALNSGTSALHLAVKALNLKPGDEVITTPFTFVATANAILFEGATPVFADIDEHTYCIDPKEVEKKITPKTKAIIDVDVFGYPSSKTELETIAKKHNLRIIEDSAEAIGATYKNKKVGSFFDAGIFAFYPNKQMTTGEGGILVTNNEEIAKLARSYRNQGRGESGPWLQHVRIGYNYRISEINCALGVSQINKIERILAQRESNAQYYTKTLSTIPNVKTPPMSTADRTVSWFVYVIQVPHRDEIMKRLKERGVNCAAYFTPLHLTEFYQKEFPWKKGDFPRTEKIAERTLALPFYTAISREQIEYVCKQLKEVIEEISDIKQQVQNKQTITSGLLIS